MQDISIIIEEKNCRISFCCFMHLHFHKAFIKYSYLAIGLLRNGNIGPFNLNLEKWFWGCHLRFSRVWIRKKYRAGTTLIFGGQVPNFFLIHLINSAFSQVATLKKFRLNSTLFFQVGKSTHLFKTKNRVQIKGQLKKNLVKTQSYIFFSIMSGIGLFVCIFLSSPSACLRSGASENPVLFVCLCMTFAVI